MSWKISKQFNFSYGHRVWVQQLNSEFALDRRCVCRHLHGHEAEVHVHLTGDELNDQGMVTDFLHLSWFKKFVDLTIDHKFIIDRNDPLFNQMVREPLRKAGGSDFVSVMVPETDFVAGRIVSMPDTLLPDRPEYEYLESFFIVDFIPTSENLAKWAYDLVTVKMARINVVVDEIEWWETPKSCARYSGGPELTQFGL